ncbi:MAG: PadR family transcriptional regulator, partial [Candidatus Nezhaarchaeales archaeon]
MSESEVMREQVKRGYLKLAILYTLLRGPAHGYEIIKKIREGTLGLISPTPGSLYPALKELEASGLVKSEWQLRKRRVRVYTITDEGREAFIKVVEKHLELASTIRRWLLELLVPVHLAEVGEGAPGLLQQIAKLVTLGEEAPVDERLELLGRLREGLRHWRALLERAEGYVD